MIARLHCSKLACRAQGSRHLPRSHRIDCRKASSLPPRASAYKTLTPSDVSHLRGILDSSTILSTLDGSAAEYDLIPYNRDWMGKYQGKSRVVVRPRTTDDVAKVVRWCSDQGVAVVPQGGNTGLVGGSTPVHDELVLSLSSMNRIRSFDQVSGVLAADAGVILSTADAYLADRGFIFPLDLGAKGSCQIGGNVATNAGGLRLLRYGSLRGSVLGLEVVLPDGRIWNGLSSLRKDNTGYDLKQLFIGSEGSIGIITGLSILCPRRPLSTNIAVFSLPSFKACLEVYNLARSHLGEILTAFEFWDDTAYAAVKKYGGGKKVFDKEGGFYVLVETGGSNGEHDSQKLSNFSTSLMKSHLIHDGVLSQTSSQNESLWLIRELCPEALSKAGKAYKYDLSVPVERMYEVVERMRIHLRDVGLLGNGVKSVAGFGHMGDGNLHLNVVADEFSETVQSAIEPYVYELVAGYNGSISAEHGLGVMKAPYISYSQTETSVRLMKEIKKSFDPKGIMNPYKYII